MNHPNQFHEHFESNQSQKSFQQTVQLKSIPFNNQHQASKISYHFMSYHFLCFQHQQFSNQHKKFLHFYFITYLTIEQNKIGENTNQNELEKLQFQNLNKKVLMHPKQLIAEIPWLVTICIAVYFATLYIHHDEPLPQEQWHYFISQHQFENHLNNHQFSTIQLPHDGEGQYEPVELLIKTKQDQYKTFLIDDLNHTHIDKIIQVNKQQIEHAIIKSTHPLNFDKDKRIRLLQSTTVNDDFIIVAGKFFTQFLPIIRNFIIVGLFTNQIDLFLPLITFTQSTLMLAFLNNEKHYLLSFYQNIFNSNLDLFNLIRLNLFFSNESESNKGNALLLKYGFRQNLFYNISGELTLALGFIMFTALIKAGTVILNLQKLRDINSKLRGIWNGFLFCLMPRILTFSSFSLRQMSIQSFEGVLYPAFAIIFLLFCVGYFVQLFLQIRKINQKLQYIEQSRNQIGMVTRIKCSHDFQFDCLKFSNLYYPVMNYLKLFIFFVPIGVVYDFTYASFGGVIVSQLLYIILSVSSSGFLKTRDGLVYPFCDFLFMMLQLAHIVVGLAQSIMHSEISVIAEKVFFSLLLTMTIFIVCSLAADVTQKIRNSFTKNGESEANIEDKEIKSTQLKRTFTKKTAQEQNSESKSTSITQKKGEADFLIDKSAQDNDSDISSSIDSKKSMNRIKPKVRKVRLGKII